MKCPHHCTMWHIASILIVRRKKTSGPDANAQRPRRSGAATLTCGAVTHPLNADPDVTRGSPQSLPVSRGPGYHPIG